MSAIRFLISSFILICTLNSLSQETRLPDFYSDNIKNFHHPGYSGDNFYSDSLPEDFPEINVEIFNDPAPGYIFLHPFHTNYSYLVIMDNHGTPIFYRRIGEQGTDFKLQPNGIMTYYSHMNRSFYGLNSHFEIADTFRCRNGYEGRTDLHELRVQENGHYFILGYDQQIVGMDTVVPGGQPDALVVGLLVQEITPDDSVVFQWLSWDHFEITDVYGWVDLTAGFIDYVHGNAIEIESDTSLLISCRNMNEITKIDRRTGDIIWRLNGKNNQFEFINDTLQFTVQHSIRLMPDSSHISIFDNGSGHKPIPFSSALEYAIDEENMTATLVKRQKRDPGIHGNWMGHTQRLMNGRTIVGWGHIDTVHTYLPYYPAVTEFKEDGSIALEISCPWTSYRAFKHLWKPEMIQAGPDTIDFGSNCTEDTCLMTLYLSNHSDRIMQINRIVHHDDHFTTGLNLPVNILAGDSIPVSILFIPGEENYYEDVFTFCEDTYENGVSQRIACQALVRAEYSSGLGTAFNDDPVEIFPNPCKGSFYIDVNNAGIRDLKICHVTGKSINPTVKSSGKNLWVDISAYPKGIYIVEILLGDGRHVSRKVVHQ